MNEFPEEAGWPRTIFISPTATEVIHQELDEDYDPDEDSGFALAFNQGAMYTQIKIESWDDLCLPNGYELLEDEDRIDYNRHLEKKEHKRRRG